MWVQAAAIRAESESNNAQAQDHVQTARKQREARKLRQEAKTAQKQQQATPTFEAQEALPTEMIVPEREDQEAVHERPVSPEEKQVSSDVPSRNKHRGDRKTEKVNLLCNLMGMPIVPMTCMPKRKALYEVYLHGYTIGRSQGWTESTFPDIFAQGQFCGNIFREIGKQEFAEKEQAGDILFRFGLSTQAKKKKQQKKSAPSSTPLPL